MHPRQQNQHITNNFSHILKKLSGSIANNKNQPGKIPLLCQQFSKQLKNTSTPEDIFYILNNMLNVGIYPHDIPIINLLIIKLGELDQIELATAIYSIAINPDCYIANDFTHSSMIKTAGKFNCKDLAVNAYQQAIETNPANIVVHNCMIDAAGKNGWMDWIIQAYQKTIDPDYYIADVFTYASVIDASSKNGCIDLSIDAYQRATNPDNYVANAITHKNMIEVGNKNGRIDLSIDAYQRATNPDNYVADNATHHMMIDALFNNGLYDEAKSLYKKAGISIPIKIEFDEILKYDLHNFNYGSTYIALSELIENSEKPFNTAIICGKGKHSTNHSKKHHDIPVLKQAVYDALEDSLQKYNINFQEDTGNSGLIYINVTQKLLINLNPDSAPFIPENIKPVNEPPVTTDVIIPEIKPDTESVSTAKKLLSVLQPQAGKKPLQKPETKTSDTKKSCKKSNKNKIDISDINYDDAYEFCATFQNEQPGVENPVPQKDELLESKLPTHTSKITTTQIVQKHKTPKRKTKPAAKTDCTKNRLPDKEQSQIQIMRPQPIKAKKTPAIKTNNNHKTQPISYCRFGLFAVAGLVTATVTIGTALSYYHSAGRLG